MSDLDEIRQKRMAELQAQQAAMQNQAQQQAMAQAQQQEAQAKFESQKKQMLAQIMTSEARNRLSNLKLTKPELVNQIELQLIQSAQAGSLRGKVTDEQLKEKALDMGIAVSFLSDYYDKTATGPAYLSDRHVAVINYSGLDSSGVDLKL